MALSNGSTHDTPSDDIDLIHFYSIDSTKLVEDIAWGHAYNWAIHAVSENAIKNRTCSE
ncbi:hypothetical protein EYZ11_002761 [Aspergillus tanneri]|uniref:Uncharacterized protein n=1 Tax=Aspergillus tanneri TaxID=1220188 RepID=A0A4S3JQ14_9EURO|nr:hypothetical protein EYZ11_002761 [Aspergillus tanneri]